MNPASNDAAMLGMRLSEAVIMFHEAIAAVRNLSASEHKALGIIERDGPMTSGELARRTGLTPGAITGIVDRLLAHGYVTRDQDPADRRRTIIRVTAAHPPEIAAAFAALRDEFSGFDQRYTPAEAAAITDWVNWAVAILEEQTRRLTARAATADEHP